jgi:hypothetical protein
MTPARSLLVAVVTVLAAAGVPLPGPLAEPASGEPVRPIATIESLQRSDGEIRLRGWIAWPRNQSRPRLDVIVDGDVYRATLRAARPDVTAALVDHHARRFRARIGVTPAESLCLRARRGAHSTGLLCEIYDAGAQVTAPGTSPVAGRAGRTIVYRVRVEGATGLDPVAVAATVDATLADERSWIGARTHRVQRTDRSDAELTIVVATPATVDAACWPLQTAGLYSCQTGNRLMLNADRWKGAVVHWTASLEEYRAYLVNHELGHYLGLGHVGCPGPGQLAPIMLQQSKFLNGCLPNGWPYP